MAELPDVAPGEVIASAHINDVRDRTVQRYVDESVRDAETPSPVSGELAFIETPPDVERALQVFDGGVWRVLAYDPRTFYSHAPNAPWAGSLVYRRFGALVSVRMNITRSIVTLNGEWNIASAIPSEWLPTTSTVYWNVAALKSSTPSSEVISSLLCRHTPGETNVVATSRIESTVALRGSWSYFA